MTEISYRLFPAVFNMSVTASVVIAVLILFRFLCSLISRKGRKIPSVVFYALWAVALFRLLCPFSFTSDMSFFARYDSPVSRTAENISAMEYVPVDIVHTEYPSVDLPAGFVSHIVNHYLPQGEEQLCADPLEAPVAIATNVWLSGIILMAVYGVYSYTNLKKQLVGSVRLKDNIYLCDYISAPFVTGIIKPKIYLPSALSEKEAEYVVLHEQQHIKRFDHIFKLMAFIALTLHWFNPLVWLAYSLAMQDMEMSCDEAVVEKLGEDIRSAYSQSLLNFAAGRHFFAGTPLAFGEGDVKVRIKNLYFSKKAGAVYVSVFIALAAILAFRLILNPDTSRGQILYNGMVYQQSGVPLITIPGERSKNIGNLGEIVEDNAVLTDELSGKNIDSANISLPIFINEETPETIFLTTGEGWVPFSALSMNYSTTDIQLEAEQLGKGIRYTAKLNCDVKECGIIEDIYMQGKLYSSRLLIYNDSVSAEDSYTDSGSFDYNVRFAENGGIDEMEFIFHHNKYVTSTSPVALPRENYTGCGSHPSFMTADNYNKKHHRFKMLANDSFDLLTIAFSTREGGSIYANFKAEYAPDEADMMNDTVIIYRFVTSSTSLRE